MQRLTTVNVKGSAHNVSDARVPTVAAQRHRRRTAARGEASTYILHDMNHPAHEIPPRGTSSRIGRRDAAGRSALTARVIELMVPMRRMFEVQPDAEQRATWRSLTIHQMEALVVLDRGSVAMRELCDQLDISESAGTALVDRLVARGMVERHPDPADRRLVRVALSDEARAMTEQYRALKRDRAAEALSVLSSEDLATLVRICEAITAPSLVADRPGATDRRPPRAGGQSMAHRPTAGETRSTRQTREPEHHSSKSHSSEGHSPKGH